MLSTLPSTMRSTISSVRPAAVAGTFYPADAAALRAVVDRCLAAADAGAPSDSAPPKLLVVPHAGFIYSGPIAAQAYARLRPWASVIRRVVLLGPVHRVAVRGLAAPTVGHFETPLGRVPIDRAALWRLKALPQVVFDDRPHAPEHALEVQLPFLQTVLEPGFTLLPLAVGDASPGQVAQVIDSLWGGPETLIVISSDMSHYLSYGQATQRDRSTSDRIVAMATDLRPDDACGARALNGAMLAARQRGLGAPRLLDLRNSGDTAGDRKRVVGYAAFELAAAAQPVADGGDVNRRDARPDAEALGAALLVRARNAIALALQLPTEPEPAHPRLAEYGATFVTLNDAHGKLRGCIGRLEAVEPLDLDVRHNAVGAALHDPRFVPVRAAEWPTLRLEVSLLEPAQPLPSFATEAAALAAITPGVHGLIFEWQGHRSTFLPQVWEQLPQPAAFIAALKQKAGLPTNFWATDVKLWCYGVQKFGQEFDHEFNPKARNPKVAP